MDELAFYGDSQTAGSSWIDKLVETTPSIKKAHARGASGQSSGSVAVRQGGAVLTLENEVVISNTDPVDVSFTCPVKPLNQRHPTLEGSLGGVRGGFYVVKSNNAAANPVGTFTPDDPVADPVTVPAGSTFVPVDVQDHPEFPTMFQMFWTGANDRAFAGLNTVPGVLAATEAMIARLQEAVEEPRFLLAGPTVYSLEDAGGAMYKRADQIRTSFYERWPDNTIDIWGHVLDNGLRILGIEPTADDLKAIEGKSMPPSLTQDNIHYTTETREQVVAPYVKSELEARGWI